MRHRRLFRVVVILYTAVAAVAIGAVLAKAANYDVFGCRDAKPSAVVASCGSPTCNCTDPCLCKNCQCGQMRIIEEGVRATHASYREGQRVIVSCEQFAAVNASWKNYCDARGWVFITVPRGFGATRDQPAGWCPGVHRCVFTGGTLVFDQVTDLTYRGKSISAANFEWHPDTIWTDNPRPLYTQRPMQAAPFPTLFVDGAMICGPNGCVPRR